MSLWEIKRQRKKGRKKEDGHKPSFYSKFAVEKGQNIIKSVNRLILKTLWWPQAMSHVTTITKTNNSSPKWCTKFNQIKKKSMEWNAYENDMKLERLLPKSYECPKKMAMKWDLSLKVNIVYHQLLLLLLYNLIISNLHLECNIKNKTIRMPQQ